MCVPAGNFAYLPTVPASSLYDQGKFLAELHLTVLEPTLEVNDQQAQASSFSFVWYRHSMAPVKHISVHSTNTNPFRETLPAMLWAIL